MYSPQVHLNPPPKLQGIPVYLPPSSFTSSPPSTLHAKLNLQQTLGWSHPSDGPPQVTGTLPVSAPNINYTQSHHFPTNKGSSRASDEAPQQLKLLNPMFASLPGSLWSRFSWRNLKSFSWHHRFNIMQVSHYGCRSQLFFFPAIPQQNQMQNAPTAVQQQVIVLFCIHVVMILVSFPLL